MPNKQYTPGTVFDGEGAGGGIRLNARNLHVPLPWAISLFCMGLAGVVTVLGSIAGVKSDVRDVQTVSQQHTKDIEEQRRKTDRIASDVSETKGDVKEIKALIKVRTP